LGEVGGVEGVQSEVVQCRAARIDNLKAVSNGKYDNINSTTSRANFLGAIGCGINLVVFLVKSISNSTSDISSFSVKNLEFSKNPLEGIGNSW
jgi:hypothetical protein